MHVYLPEHKQHSLFVTPANDPRGNALDGASQWRDANGSPIMYNIRFRDGRASVEKLLGEWLIKYGYARRTRLIIPGFIRSVA